MSRRPDNGMSEAETGASLSGSDAIMKRSNEEGTEMMELKTKFESRIKAKIIIKY